MDRININKQYSLLKNPSVLDPSGKSPSEYGFDVDGYLHGINDIDGLRSRLLLVVKYLEKENINISDINQVCKNLRRLLVSKKDSAVTLADIKEQLYKITQKTRSCVLDKNPDRESQEYKANIKQYDAARSLEKLIYPLLRKHIEQTQKMVLPYSKSGVHKYPEKHSFFASSVQELTAASILDKVADEITKGYTIESALLRLEDKEYGDSILPRGLTHRLSESFTNDPDANFELLIIRGGVYPDEKKDKISKADKKFSAVIKKEFPDLCKKITTIKNPSFESIEKNLALISKRIKRNNTKKLYIAFNGHGDAEGLQEGVQKRDRNLQGAASFIFMLNPKNELSEEQIKELYNKYLKDIEVITIFDACHSGSAITAIENTRRLDVLA